MQLQTMCGLYLFLGNVRSIAFNPDASFKVVEFPSVQFKELYEQNTKVDLLFDGHVPRVQLLKKVRLKKNCNDKKVGFPTCRKLMVSRMRLYELMPPVKTSLRSLSRRKCFNTITSGASTGNFSLKSVISLAERTPFCMLKLMSTFTSDFFSVSLTIGTCRRQAKNESRKLLTLILCMTNQVFMWQMEQIELKFYLLMPCQELWCRTPRRHCSWWGHLSASAGEARPSRPWQLGLYHWNNQGSILASF